jgi:hypothetical protein
LLECSGQGLGNDDMDGEILELHGDVCEPARAYIYTHVGAGRVVRVLVCRYQAEGVGATTLDTKVKEEQVFAKKKEEQGAA